MSTHVLFFRENWSLFYFFDKIGPYSDLMTEFWEDEFFGLLLIHENAIYFRLRLVINFHLGLVIYSRLQVWSILWNLPQAVLKFTSYYRFGLNVLLKIVSLGRCYSLTLAFDYLFQHQNTQLKNYFENNFKTRATL